MKMYKWDFTCDIHDLGEDVAPEVTLLSSKVSPNFWRAGVKRDILLFFRSEWRPLKFFGAWIPGGKYTEKHLRLSWTILRIVCSFSQCSCRPCTSKVGPVFHHPPAQLYFLFRKSKRWVLGDSEDKRYLRSVSDTHPFWPRVEGGSVGKIVCINRSTSLCISVNNGTEIKQKDVYRNYPQKKEWRRKAVDQTKDDDSVLRTFCLLFSLSSLSQERKISPMTIAVFATVYSRCFLNPS